MIIIDLWLIFILIRYIKEKIINGELHIYCESDGEYYPKHKTENGVQMELDEKYASVILRRYVENTGNADGVYCIRYGVKIHYLDIVKEVVKKSDYSGANDLI